MSEVSEHDAENALGLPGPLPRGEHVLWHGVPDWRALAVHTLHVRKVAVYFAALLALRYVVAIDAGATVNLALAEVVGLTLPALAGLGMLALFAWLTARNTVYTLTDRRLVMKIGIALPMSVSLPLNCVDGASLKRFRDGSGEIALTLNRQNRASYVVMWPHVRTLKLLSVTPVLRGLPEPDEVARRLGDALNASAPSVEARERSADFDLAATGT